MIQDSAEILYNIYLQALRASDAIEADHFNNLCIKDKTAWEKFAEKLESQEWIP